MNVKRIILESIKAYIGFNLLMFGAVILLGGVSGVLDKMLSSSLQTWFELYIMLNEMLLFAIFITAIILSASYIYNKLEKITDT